MANSRHVDYDRFPQQSQWLGKDVFVCFNFQFSRLLKGKIIRHDVEGDCLTLIQLEDGRVITDDECSYTLAPLVSSSPSQVASVDRPMDGPCGTAWQTLLMLDPEETAALNEIFLKR